MQERHQNRELYFNELAQSFEEKVLPYIESIYPIQSSMHILEVGCGEGGNLVPFLKKGCTVVGVDFDQVKVQYGQSILSPQYPDNQIRLITQDIYKTSPAELGQFDLIILRDVIEHIHDQQRFLGYIKQFLTPSGCIFFAFPPWYMPFGGHQQICRSRILSMLPYIHLLPRFLYRVILKVGGEREGVIGDLLEIKETALSIERFDRILKREGYQIVQKTLFLINPYYEVKFKLKARKQNNVIAAIPYLRDFCSTSCYCLVKLPVTKE